MNWVPQIIAHESATHIEAGIISKLLHQPTWIGLLASLLVIVTVYFIAKRLNKALPVRLLLVLATTIIVGILYVPYSPTVTGIVLSAGFILTFFLSFTMLGKSS